MEKNWKVPKFLFCQKVPDVCAAGCRSETELTLSTPGHAAYNLN